MSASAASARRPAPVDVISIQSQVVYGSVGNSIALPALQRLGLRAAAVPSAVLSNTPHYPSVHGGALPPAWFAGYLDDLQRRGVLADAGAVLVGYLGGEEQARALAGWLERVCAVHPQLKVHVDPVIGDFDHGAYAEPRMLAAWREHLLPHAHALTPNHFELEKLAGTPLRSLEECVGAARDLLIDRTEWVVVTSAAPQTWPPDEMHVAVVTRDDHHLVTHPRIEDGPKGAGDLFGALLLGRRLAGAGLTEAVEAACRDVLDVLRYAADHGWEELVLPPDWLSVPATHRAPS